MIEKIQRYIGLLVGIALLVLTFTPVRGDGYRYYRNASPSFYLDRTAAADLLSIGMLHFEPWAALSDYVNTCSPFGAGPIVGSRTQIETCSEFPPVFNHDTFPRRHADTLGERAPGLIALLQQYRAVAKVKPTPEGERRTDISLRFEKQILQELTPWLEEVRKRRQIQTLIAHGGLTLMAVLFILFRQQVGRFLFPAHLLFRGGVATVKAAKSLHDKV